MSDEDPYARTVRQAAHDAVRALLATPPDSVAGSEGLRAVVTWLVREHGAGALVDLAEELAVDLAEAFTAVAAAEGRAPLDVLDAWFHDAPVPQVPAPAPAPAEDPAGQDCPG